MYTAETFRLSNTVITPDTPIPGCTGWTGSKERLPDNGWIARRWVAANRKVGETRYSVLG